MKRTFALSALIIVWVLASGFLSVRIPPVFQTVPGSLVPRREISSGAVKAQTISRRPSSLSLVEAKWRSERLFQTAA